MSIKANIDEKELVKGCIIGDRKAQWHLYEKFKKPMFTISYRILSDFDAANDSLQEAFIEIFRDIKNFGFKSSIGTWIKTIVIRKAIYNLKNTVKLEPIENIDKNEVIEWTDSFTAEDLDKAIKSLPAQARAVFNLIEVEGYKHKEVAEMLEINEGTSKSQLHYAKSVLKKKLSES